MCVGHLLLILTMLCGIIAYPATPNAQRHMPHVNRDDIDLDQSHANRIVDDDFNHYRYQQARERMAQQEHDLDTRYDNDDANEDDPPRRVSFPRYFNHEDEVDDDDEHQGFGKRAGGPSLSIVNPLDVLRQRLQLEMARRKQKENLNRIESNAHLFNSIGKRSTRQEAPPRPPMTSRPRRVRARQILAQEAQP